MIESALDEEAFEEELAARREAARRWRGGFAEFADGKFRVGVPLAMPLKSRGENEISLLPAVSTWPMGASARSYADAFAAADVWEAQHPATASALAAAQEDEG